jgi:Fungal specific transcription factor domain
MIPDINGSRQQYSLGSHTKFYPPRDLCFPIIIQDEAAIEAMLAYAAIRLGHGTRGWPLEALSYRAKSIALVNERLRDPKRQLANPTISAIIGILAHLTELRIEVIQ